MYVSICDTLTMALIVWSVAFNEVTAKIVKGATHPETLNFVLYDDKRGYTTNSANRCIGKCPYWGALCLTDVATTEQCTTVTSKRVLLRESSNNKYLPCSNKCERHNSLGYNWCTTSINTWERCEPGHYVFVADNPAKRIMSRCLSPCKMYKDKFHCYDEHYSWTACYPFQDMKLVLVEVFKNYNGYGAHNGTQYLPCVTCLTGDANAFNVDEVSYIESVFDFVKVKNIYDQLFPRGNLRNITYSRSNYTCSIYENKKCVKKVDLGEHKNPVLNFNVYIINGNFDDNDLVVPMSLSSLITYYNMPKENIYRTSVPIPSNLQFNFMRQNPLATDVLQYLILPEFGGERSEYNMIPASSALTGNLFGINGDVYRFLNKNKKGYILYDVLLGYNNSRTPYRPTSVGLRLRFHNNEQIRCDKSGRTLTPSMIEARSDDYEYIHFINSDNYECNTKCSL